MADEKDQLLDELEEPFEQVGMIMPTITCGCGFSVSGFDEEANRWAHADHICGDESPGRWYHSVFSLTGALVIFIAGYVAIEILKAVSHG